MIKILVLIIILIIRTASGTVTVGVSSTNHVGITFSDCISLTGDNIGAGGVFALSDDGICKDMRSVVTGTGKFVEDTKTNRPGGYHQGFSYDIYKMVQNDGSSGKAYSKTVTSLNGEYISLDSYLQTNNCIDYAMMNTIADNANTFDSNKISWQFENVQTESQLSRISWNDHAYSVKIKASSGRAI